MKMKKMFVALATIALLSASFAEAQSSEKIASAEATAERYGVKGYHAPAPHPPATPQHRVAPIHTANPKATTPVSIGVGYSQARVSGRSSNYGHGYGGSHRTSGRSNALSVAVGIGNALVGTPMIGSGIMPPIMGGGYGGNSSSEAEAYRRGYEEEQRRLQRERERTAEQAGRTDARQGTWRPHYATPGEQAAYEKGHNRERERMNREREKEARDAGREAARNQSGWGW